jgi:GntR family transcriptional regulator
MTTPTQRSGHGAVARPLYTQVRDLMIERIESGLWPIGTALPNEVQLSSEFGVSVGTIRRAVEGLEEAGILVRKQGRGTFVAGSPSSQRSARLYPFRLHDGSLWSPSFDPPVITRRAATRDDHRQVGFAGPDVIVFERVGRSQNVAVLDEVVTMPSRLFPDTASLTAEFVAQRYQRSDLGFDIAKIIDVLAVAETRENERASLSSGGPLLRIERRILDGNERTIEWGTVRADTSHLRYVGTR